MRRNRTDYAINRYYSPDTGRFTTHDPLTELDRPERLNQPQGLNLYPYVMGGPTRYTDPTGEDWWYRTAADGEHFAWVPNTDKDRLAAKGHGYKPIPRDKEFGPLLNPPAGREAWGKSDLIAVAPSSANFFSAIVPKKGLPVAEPPPSVDTDTRAVPDIKQEQRKNQAQDDFDEAKMAHDAKIGAAVLDFQGEAAKEAILGFGIGRGLSLLLRLRRAQQAARAARLAQEAADAEIATVKGTLAEYNAAKEAGVTKLFPEGGANAGSNAARVASEEAAAARAMVQAATVARVRQLAGFAEKGTPIIVDNSLGVNPTRVAEALRARGYNARSVGEIFGRDPKDPAILELAEALEGRVLAADRGRDLAGGFGQRTIRVDGRIRSVDSVIRLLVEALK